MERRGRPRSKSASRKSQPAKSPRGRPKKVPSANDVPKKREPSRSRTRGRPAKLKDDEPKPRTQRSRSRSASRGRGSSRPRRAAQTPKKKEERDSDEDDQPLNRRVTVSVTDVLRSNSKGHSNNLTQLVRRSIEREPESTRRSARNASRVASSSVTTTKGEWTTQTLSTSKIEFGGWLGVTVQILGFFAVLAATFLGCTKEQCSLKAFHIPRNWRYYLNHQAALGVGGFVLLQALLSALPIGRVVKCSTGRSTYRANGFLAMVLTALGVVGAWWQGYPVSLAYERYISGATAAYVLAWGLALALWVKGGRAPVPGLNPYGNSGNPIYDVYMGREINPVLGGVNLKIALLRTCLIGTMLLGGLVTLKGFEVNRTVSPALGAVVALQAFYCLDSLWFEESFVSTFEAQYEGVGLMMTQGLLLYPFFAALLPRVVLQYRIERGYGYIAAVVAVFAVGYFIYRASNLQKATFRRNPLDPAISSFETISTSRGKKLLVAGWWGRLKHPNYTGDIILTWAIAAIIGLHLTIPYIVPLLSTILLLHRAKRDDHRCSERYQAAWTEYRRRVPYAVIPYVY